MRLQEITLTALNLEEMRQFYCAVLGFREVEPYWTGRLVVQAGETRLIFMQGPQDFRGRYHFAFNVPPDRFEPSLAWLRERRGLITGTDGQTRFHSDNWDADNVYFTDPQGNILELIGRAELAEPAQAAITAERTPADDEARRLANRPFAASEIACVSEIGVCVRSVVDAAAALTGRVPRLDVYKGPVSDTFGAVGDPQGLLILVQQNRIWFPNTGVPAEFLPLEVLFRLENGAFYRLTAPPFPFDIRPT